MSNSKLYNRKFHDFLIVGNDPLQFQEEGGNTSTKNDNSMWVKAYLKAL